MLILVPLAARWLWPLAEPCCPRGGPSQGDAGAVMSELAGQDAPVDLVKLHQLDEIGKARLAVIHGEVKLPLFLALQRNGVGGCVLSSPGPCLDRAGREQPAPLRTY